MYTKFPAPPCPVRQAAFVQLKEMMADSDKWQRALAHKYLHECLEEFEGEYPKDIDSLVYECMQAAVEVA